MKVKSINIPFQQWLHIVRYEYDYAGDEQEYRNNGVAHIVGKTFQYAVECRYDFVPFINAFVSSDVFQYFERNMSIYSQSPYHILAAFDSEMMGKGMRMQHLEEEQTEQMEAAYWIGYLLMQWKLTDGISGAELAARYDLGWLFEQYEQGDFKNLSIHKAIQSTKAKFDFKVL